MDAQQNKIAYITGSSRGIGKALVQALIAENYQVFGLSRSAEKSASNFTPIQLDLNDLEAVKAFEFKPQVDHVLLVNNAGMIGDIGPVGSIPNETIEAVLTVNSIAPQLLMNTFIKTYMGKVKHGHIINISSGAGKYAIDAWASYCASKAAIDLFSETIKHEWLQRNIENWHIHSIAPGVVDTQMQSEIRSAKPALFKSHEKFIQLKANNELSSPEAVSNKLLQVILSPESFADTTISVRDY